MERIIVPITNQNASPRFLTVEDSSEDSVIYIPKAPIISATDESATKYRYLLPSNVESKE